jgi:tetratricopeptide (TPR) repeat protein
LVKSYEILEALHGPNHPSIGAACLAIASVQNAVGKFGEAREWLSNALRAMEKLDPIPLRALAFTQIQLSSVLFKQKYTDEALQVIVKAISFYLDKSREGIGKASLLTYDLDAINPQSPILSKHSRLLTEDIQQCLALMQKLVDMCDKIGAPYQSLEQLEVMADLAESAFGWDSDKVGLYRKEVIFFLQRCIYSRLLFNYFLKKYVT